MEKSEVIKRLHQAESNEAGQLLRDVLRANVREALYDLVEEEVKSLCGPSHHPKEDSPYYRSGTVDSHIYLDSRRTEAKRPRVRQRSEADGSIEVHLKTWKTAQCPDAWEEAMMRAILCGVSTRDQKRLHESELKGMSKSNVSRLWQRKAASLVNEMMGRDLSKEPILCLMLDGVHLSDNLYAIIGLGIYEDGHKEILGFRIGSSETLEICKDFVADLVHRGLKPVEGLRLLAVLDGSNPLKQAVLKFFPNALIQRCLVHKERNIRGYLPRQHWLRLSQLFADLRRCQGSEASIEALDKLKTFLASKNKAAQESLEEPGEELLSFFHLEVPSTLNVTFLSTNIIENSIKNLRRHIGRVCRWRDEGDHPERWLASGLQLAQRGFRKVRGYRDLDALQKALQRENKPEVAA